MVYLTCKRMMFWGIPCFSMLIAAGSVVSDRMMGRGVQVVQAPVVKVVRDSWLDAARVGAPIYRTQDGPVALPPLPVGKAIVLTGNGYAFASDDLADVRRWYATLTAPVLDLSAYPAVRYVYEVESVELETDADGRKVLAVTIHEARTGCERPACDPVTELPNYDRRYVVKPANATIYIAGNGHA